MRIYLNAQFADGRHRPHLLSVGLVSRFGELYRIADDAHAVRRALDDRRLREHVLSRLPVDLDGRDWRWDDDHPDRKCVSSAIADEVLDFIDAHYRHYPELWAWHGAYGYTAVRHLYGTLAATPAGFPQWCGELAAEHARLGKPSLPPRNQEGGLHALEQARWTMQADRALAECATRQYTT